MTRPLNYRVLFLLVVLLVAGMVQILREHRPSWLRPGLRLNAYVSAADGSVAVVDVVRLSVIARVAIGAGLSGMREHPTRPEIWGVSSTGGYVWILEARSNQVVARIPVGSAPYALDFSPDGRRAYTTASGADSLVVIDVITRSIIATAHTGSGPVLARSASDGKHVLVVNRRDATLRIYDADNLA